MSNGIYNSTKGSDLATLHLCWPLKNKVFIFMSYNKVLLRERKRHTARRVSSARYAGGGYPVPGPGGYPVPGLGGYPIPGLRGYPIPGPGEYPIPGWGGTLSQVRGYPIQTWSGGYPRYPPDLRWGTPQPDLGWGTPPPARPGMGYPPPPPRNVNRQTFPSINITFPRTTYAGGKNCVRFPQGSHLVSKHTHWEIKILKREI